jgi:hypothetical protein
MLKGGSLLRVQEMQLEGKGWRESARETCLSRNTVRKYLCDTAASPACRALHLYFTACLR